MHLLSIDYLSCRQTIATKRLRFTLITVLALLQSCSSVMGPSSEDLGKRTFGTKWDDQAVESRGKANIKSMSPELDEAHVGIVSFNGVVLLVGQVPSQTAKDAATEAVEGLRKVLVVHNELEVAGPISFMARVNDSWLTTKVKTALLTHSDSEGRRIKVLTENGIVYMMGLVTRNEADNAVERARGVFGVKKIVKVFEYLD
jgi:osmotically-inducible protein OsmY